ncbi:carbohydrate kinase [Cellulomonas chitinilytica]|uniref:Carbohydrate kinase n=1 Tax=Cellulomonas chitinilytica TaxID=398759 RepID=A0A919P9I9_9CELL|nr:rhamnulokinase family protein [Cellulomonas chitinilytica]GIG23734.1 carbohydrate kinase [Cellulomonas chitinilytica]
MPAFAAVDLGASSGRVIVGRVLPGDGGPRVELHEVNRFANGPVAVPAVRASGRGAGAASSGGPGAGPGQGGEPTLHWDVLHLYRGVLDGLRAATRDVGVLDGVGIDSWAVDHGLLDADGVLLGNPVHYRDRRTAGIPEKVFATVPAEELYARTGLQVQPFNTVFQLVAAQGTAQLAAARRALLIPDLLGAWLTGVEVAEVTNASTTGLLDATTRTWATDLAARLGIDATLLAPLRDAGTLLGHVHDETRTDVGHRAPLPVWTVGSHDTASAVVAVPATDDDFAYISCGTWSLVGLELSRPVLSEAGRRANFTNEAGVDGTVRYLRNVMGLWVLQESIRTWNDAGLPADLPDLLAAAARVPALTTVVDIDAPELLPPGDMPTRIAALAVRTGQSPPQSQAETVRCILDSLALAYRRAVREAATLADRDVRVVHVVGGGVRNELLCRLTADATGLPVVAGPAEGAALGNVLVQARAAGVLPGDVRDLRDLRRVGARGLDLRRYVPGDGPSAAQWDAAERRVLG